MLISWRVGRPVAVCCGVLALAACGASTTAAPPGSTTPPSQTARSPYTATATTLRVGQSAVVAWPDDVKPGGPVGTLKLAVTEVSDGEVAGLAVPDPGTPPSFNDVTFLVHVSATNTGTIPIQPGGLFGRVTVYDARGKAMTPATTSDQSCTDSLDTHDALPPGGRLTDCKAYLGSALAPHIAKVVFRDSADAGPTTITWTPQ